MLQRVVNAFKDALKKVNNIYSIRSYRYTEDIKETESVIQFKRYGNSHRHHLLVSVEKLH